MAKDTAKLEKQNKKLKKKNAAGGKVILFLLLIIVILAALLFFLDPFGWGTGPNAGQTGGYADTGSQGAQAADTAAAADTDAPAETEPEELVAWVYVTVSGATYTDADGKETSAAEIVEAAKATDLESHVIIIDDSATLNAMDELKAALEAENIPYSINNKE